MTTALDWWASLSTGGRARLRRCARPADALLLPETLDLIRRLRWPRYRTEHAAILAMVLAHVREIDNRPIMRACGRARFGDDTAPLSQARFRRLITATDPDDLHRLLTSLVRIAGGAANITELENVLRWWTDQTRQQWARDYYAAAIETEGTEQ